jgi:hypothetical protein
VRNPLLPDKLKNLFERHMYTHEMPDESLEEESRIQVCIYFPFTTGTFKIAVPHLSVLWKEQFHHAEYYGYFYLSAFHLKIRPFSP